MIWRSVVGKLWLTIVGVGSMALILLGMMLAQLFENYFYTREASDLKVLTQSVVKVLENAPNRGDALTSVTQLIESNYRTIFVVNQDNRDALPRTVQRMLDDPRLADAWRGQTVVFRGQFPDPTGKTRAYMPFLVSAEAHIANDGLELVLIYETDEPIQTARNKIDQLIFASLIIVLLITTLFALFLTRRITLPLREMNQAANHIAEGHYDMRLSIDFQDEIGSLARSFNHMARQLEETMSTLKRERDQLTLILRGLGEGVISVDDHLRIRLMNAHAENLLTTIFGSSDVLPTVLLSMFEDTVANQREEKRTIEHGGSTLIVLTSPLIDKEKDKILGAVGVLRDVTQERKLDRLRHDFIANVSHELKTPIAMLQGYTEALLDGVYSSPEEQRELINILYEESLRMGRLVYDLLDYTRIETGHFELNIEEASLQPLIDRLRRRYSALSAEQDVLLRITCDVEGRAWVDPHRLEQILINLLDNAFRYTSKGGHIDVHLWRDGAHLKIDVADSGTGIADEDLPFLFERFYKADKARTRKGEGTGLGLAIVKRLVEAHHGTITVESQLGMGTTFHIDFPYAFVPPPYSHEA